MAFALNILHFFPGIITRAQASGWLRQKRRTSSVPITRKAVERASDTAAEGCEAQAARWLRAGSPVRGSIM